MELTPVPHSVNRRRPSACKRESARLILELCDRDGRPPVALGNTAAGLVFQTIAHQVFVQRKINNLADDLGRCNTHDVTG